LLDIRITPSLGVKASFAADGKIFVSTDVHHIADGSDPKSPSVRPFGQGQAIAVSRWSRPARIGLQIALPKRYEIMRDIRLRQPTGISI